MAALLCIMLAPVFALQVEPAAAQTVQIDLGPEIELQTFAEYVATTLSMNLIYERSALSKRISLQVSQPIPKSSLRGLLQSVLKTHGFALVAAEEPTWYRIVTLQSADGGRTVDQLGTDIGGAEVVTFVLMAENVQLDRLKAAIEPLLTKQGGTIQTIPENRLLIITDFAQNVRRMRETARLIDSPRNLPQVERIPVRFVPTQKLIDLITQILAEQSRVAAEGREQLPLSLQVDPVTGDLLAIGSPSLVSRARALAAQFDVALDQTAEVYHPKFVSTGRIKKLLGEFIQGLPIRIVGDDETNALIVTASPQQHRQIRALIERFDLPPEADTSPMRFYRLQNRRADDVFVALAGLLGAGGYQGDQRSPAPNERSGDPLAPGSESPTPEPGAAAIIAVQGEGFSMSLDEHTNSIIMIATPEVHRQVSEMIRRLDQRRPQVLVEVTLVSISADESLNLGVELEALDLGDPWDFLLFSSFGLSGLTPATGERMLNVLPGGTGILLAPDEVPIIVQALQTKGKTRVYSAPRLLVDDNATGRLESVAESPFTSVNASDTVATTSFAGFAKAGTQLSITPHIAEGDHLEIEYDITVSSFTGAGDGSVPPPRSSDTISSTVRVPDSYTVVVGGLLTETLGESESEIPGLGDVPILELLAGTRSKSKSKVRLYAFIRPTVMRHETFEDLKYISSEDLETSGIADGFPPDRVQFMK